MAVLRRQLQIVVIIIIYVYKSMLISNHCKIIYCIYQSVTLLKPHFYSFQGSSSAWLLLGLITELTFIVCDLEFIIKFIDAFAVKKDWLCGCMRSTSAAVDAMSQCT